MFKTSLNYIIYYILQNNIDQHNRLAEELKRLDAQADSQLREEKSKTSTLLKVLQAAPLKTELALLKDKQQLKMQLQETEGKVQVCIGFMTVVFYYVVTCRSQLFLGKSIHQIITI